MEALQEGASLAVYNPDTDTLRTCEGRGIKTLAEAIGGDKGFFAGALAADKTVGRAAALLFVYAEVAEVYGAVMSESAAEVLKEYGIKFSYGRLVPNILDRTGSDVCPMEKLAAGCPAPFAAWELFSAQTLGK